MRRDLEEWLKGKTTTLRGLETADNNNVGLPVIRLHSSSETPFRPTPEGSLALLPHDVRPPSELGEGTAFNEVSLSPPSREEGALAHDPASIPSVPERETVEAAAPFVKEAAPEPDVVAPESPEVPSRSGEGPVRGFGAEPPLPPLSEPAPSPSEDPAEGTREEESMLPSPSGEALEAGEAMTPPSEDIPRTTSEEDAPPDPLLLRGDEGSEEERDIRLAQHLRKVTQQRHSKIMQRVLSPRHRSRIFVLCAVAILILGALFVLYGHMQRNSLGNIAKEARQFYDQGRYDKAMELYQRGFDRYPNSEEVLLGLARSSEAAGHPDQALTVWRLHLDRLSGEDSENRGRALYEIGRLYAATKDPDKAIAHLMQSASLVPISYNTHFALGRLLEERGRPVEALDAYRRALDVRPSSNEALGAVKRVAGLMPDAKPVEPKNPLQDYEKHLEVGTVALNLKRYDDAAAYFLKALALRSDDERPWLGLAGAYQGDGKAAEALKLLRDAEKNVAESVTFKAKIDELEQALEKASPPKKRKRATPKK